jgi:membrane-associated phospholipid phosphatase
MKSRKARRGLRIALAATTTLSVATTATTALARTDTRHDHRRDNVVLRWNQAGLDAIINSRLGPPMVARAMAVLHTCVYDAWAAYDWHAAGTRFGTRLRQPARERTQRNKNLAISYAAYTAAVDLWPELTPRFDAVMADLGYPTRGSTRAGAVGTRACRAVLDHRHHDGSNQLGDLAPGAYSDYTGYQPVNAPMDIDAPMASQSGMDPNRWQPLIFTNAAGQRQTQAFSGPQWWEVEPFALRSWNQFKLPPPAPHGSAAYVRQARDLVNYAARLTDRQKAISEYWADEGPGFVGPPGTWARIAQFVSRRDRHDVDADAKMFFAMTNAIFDASIAVWGTKRKYDYVRPVTAIRYLYWGKRIPSYSHAGTGPEMIDGADWWPYQPAFFATPGFAEYPSGHSAFGGAGGEVLKRFTGSDRYGDSVTMPAGSSRVEPGVSPQANVTLYWPTFTSAVKENGISRLYGGLHFKDANLDGQSLGRQAGEVAWAKATRYFAGIAGPRDNGGNGRG